MCCILEPMSYNLKKKSVLYSRALGLHLAHFPRSFHTQPDFITIVLKQQIILLFPNHMQSESLEFCSDLKHSMES